MSFKNATLAALGQGGNGTTVLMADDDPVVLGAMSEMLELEGYSVRACLNGREAIKCFESLQPSVVILGISMPELDGLASCRIVRATSSVPILMLGAIDGEWGAVHALESGADDYIRKPVSASEFVARVRAALRRSALVATDATDPIAIGHIVIDPREHEVYVDGRLAELSPIELRLLTYLAKNQNHVQTHDDTLTAVWGAGYSGSRHVLRVTMSRLRHKLGLTDSRGVNIRTVEGVGYRLVVQEPNAILPPGGNNSTCVTPAEELKRADLALRESERGMRALVDNMNLPVRQLDAQGRVVYANPYLFALLDYRQDEIVGADWIERFVPEEDRAEARYVFHRLMEGDAAASHSRSMIVCRDGTRRMLVWHSTVIRGSDGSVCGSISIAEDVTAEHQVRLSQWGERGQRAF